MDHSEIWDEEAAEGYDEPGTGMFAPEVLDPVVARLAELAGGGPVLEFAIGTGRVALPLLARGVAVSGIEMSPAMLAQLRRKVDAAGLPVVLGDMATARVAGEFALVFLVFNGLSNLLTQDQQLACFHNAARHLAPGGRFVIEMWVPRLPHPGDAQALVGRMGAGYLMVDQFDVAAQIVVSHHFRFDAGKEARLFRSPHRYVWPAEMDLMAQAAGFVLESRDADWAGAPFTATSGSHVSVYRRI